MPRIPDQLLNSVVYLFQDEKHAREGKGAGGTGFLIDYPSEASRTYVVSNIHVVANGCTTLRINTEDGGVATAEIPRALWIDHPDSDDVSVAHLDFDIPSGWAITALPWDEFGATPGILENLNVGVGDDVFMLGPPSTRAVAPRGDL